MKRRADRSVAEKLREYQVPPAGGGEIRRTVEAGKRLILSSSFHGVPLVRRVAGQLRYLSPALWGGELAVLAACVWLAGRIDGAGEPALLLSALAFFTAGLGILGFPELCRSFSCRMWELEQSCKYDLRQIMALRLGLLGGLDLVLLAGAAAVAGRRTGLPLWETALYLLVPFNLTCIASFFALRLARGKGAAALAVPAGVGTALASSAAVSRFALCAPLLPLWALALVVTWAVLVERAVDFLHEVEEGGLSPCS